jgi:hypothetical protein
VLGGIYLIDEGKNSSGLASIVTALIGLVSVFIYGKREQKKELAAKAGQFSDKQERQ